MKKFESNHKVLDVLNIAEYIPCYLNRQIIMILSALGIPDSVFINLQDKMLKRQASMLVNKQSATRAITKFYRGIFSFVTNKTSSKFDYLHEPFFRDLLTNIYRKELTGLIYKSRIFVEKGRIMMGALDEYACLKEDQVIPSIYYNGDPI